MKTIKIGLAVLSITAAAALTTAFTVAKKVNHNIEGKGFAVVELYTSEGCSSCPPADELVAKVQKESADKPVYILAFHVDYWNRLGWKDAFSSADYSARQQQYAHWLRSSEVYTPQAIVNGTKEFVGSEEGTLRNAIKTGLQTAAKNGLTLSDVKLSSDKAGLQYHVDGATANSSLLVALIQKNAITKVMRGENGGRTLSHVQIVRKLETVSLGSHNTGSVNIALPTGFSAEGWELIGFVQNNSTGEITGAAKAAFPAAVSK